MARIEPRDHGYVSEPMLAAAGASRAQLLDLATPGNLQAPPGALLDTLFRTALNTYPDPQALAARTAIATRLGCEPEAILLGNGSSELLWICGRALAEPDASVLVVMPGPGELTAGARAGGARVVQWRAVERTGHAVDLQQIAELIALEKPVLANLSAPAWPSGAPVYFRDLQLLAASFPDVRFVIDHSELEVSELHSELTLAPPPNVLYVRSIGKALGLQGLRVGYLWAQPALCAFLESRRPSFSTNSLAHAAAELWPSQAEFIGACRSRLLEDRTRLAGLLGELGLAPTPSVTGALLVRVTRASQVAHDLLLHWQIAVRDCSVCGLPDHLRISGVSSEDAPRLLRALGEVLAQRGISGGREG
ncbi:MAG TPA: aminotransferase class I/II-fold pyridoxal phosphate-dependent enzyme [Polyangiales bacterium]|nr:aminotransferase class I/II-fold pyridoxal phosphate-dependent enzyme [Polyangiales bacterium]